MIVELINDITTLDPTAVPVSGKLITWQQFHAKFAKALKRAGNDEAAVTNKLVKTNTIDQLYSMMEVETLHLNQEHTHALKNQSKRLVTAQESLIGDVFNQALIDTIEIANTAIKLLNLDHQTNLRKIVAKYAVYRDLRKEYDISKARKRAAAKSISSQSKKNKRTLIDNVAARGGISDDNIVQTGVVSPLLATPLIHNHIADADERASCDVFTAELIPTPHSKIYVIDVDESPNVSEHGIVYTNTPYNTAEIEERNLFLCLSD